jgi:hypothetical protein
MNNIFNADIWPVIQFVAVFLVIGAISGIAIGIQRMTNRAARACRNAVIARYQASLTPEALAEIEHVRRIAQERPWEPIAFALNDLKVAANGFSFCATGVHHGRPFGFGITFTHLWRANYTPKLKKRTALLRKLKDVFRRYQSQPVDRVVSLINPMLRGWVNYFAVGHSSACFSFIKDWVEKKVRRHMLRARKRKGFGWTRWSRPWLYETLKLFNGYRVRRSGPKVAPAG